MTESYDPATDTDESPFPFFYKDPEERDRIKECVKGFSSFDELDEEVKKEVIDAMELRNVTNGEEIFHEGDYADLFYVVHHGLFQAFKSGEKDSVATYKDCFGQTALLYIHKRSTTVRAVENGALWFISRITFRRLVIKRNYEKCQKYLPMVSSVPEFQLLSENELMTVAYALRLVNLEKGETLFEEEKDIVNGMYFVDHGTLRVTKKTQEINQVGPDGYVGELASETDQKRDVTVTAITDSKVAFLEQKVFEKSLGPYLDISKRHRSN